MILAIGHLSIEDGGGPLALRQQGYRFAGLAELNAALLRETRPDMVISALIGDDFDAVDVARRLTRLGYKGPYRALSPPLPCPEAVREEIREAAPGLDFDLLVISQDPGQPA